MEVIRTTINRIALLVAVTLVVLTSAVVSRTQTLSPTLKPDLKRAFSSVQDRSAMRRRPGGYVARGANGSAKQLRSSLSHLAQASSRSGSIARILPNDANLPALSGILPGTNLSRVLHTSQLSLSSSAGTNEQYVDRTFNLVADERTTFDSTGGSFDMAVGVSGARYEVYSATLNNTLVGVLVVAVDTNGDFQMDTASTFELERDFQLPSAAAVVTGVSNTGREFVIVCSSGYYNSADPNDPNNEASPGVLLLVRDPNTGGFDNSLTRQLVTVGDNRLYNANGLTLLPNNELLIADFHSNELRIVRDTNGDGMPDTLDPAPYYSYRFSDDAPLDVAANSRGVVFSHSEGNDSLMLALYDDNKDGFGDVDEVVVAGLSLDNNLFLHGLTVDRVGNVYVIEDASGPTDGANGGTPRIIAFPDGNMNGFLEDGAVFAASDSANLALTGLALGALPPNPIEHAQTFVRQHYLDFLNREPDPGGLAYWTGNITECGNNVLCVIARRTGVSASFFIEQEFQNTGSFVYRLYKAGLGRPPEYTEFVPDRSQLDVLNLEPSKQAFALSFVQRNAFAQKYAANTTAESFVDALLATIQQSSYVNLGSQRAALIGKYGTGSSLNQSRAFVLRDAVDSVAFTTAEYNPSFVLMQYFGYLGRNPDQGGYDFWLNVLNNREPNNYRGMVCSFITSREYQERFGLRLSRSNSDCSE